MITFKHKGNLSKTTRFLKKVEKLNFSDLDRFGQAGVAALSNATPVDSGLTAQSWYYQIVQKPGVVRIEFCNSHIEDGVPIAIILQYGHGTGTGGYVQGRDYINPAIQPIFDAIANDAWREVVNA